MFKKLKYKFDTALERDFSNLVLFLLIFSLVGIVIFAVIFGILQLLGLTSKDVSFFHIKAHQKLPVNNYKHWYGNKMADFLATSSINTL